MYISMNCNRTLFCIMVCSYAAMEHRKVKKKKLKQGENIELFKITNIMCIQWLS